MSRIRTGIGAAVLCAAFVATGCNDGAPGAADTSSSERNGFDTLAIPNGTVVHASLDTALSTAVNRSRDTFTATTTEAIRVRGRTLMPVGSQIHGVLRDVEDSGRVEGRARMTMGYQSIMDPLGARYGIGANPLILQAASDARDDIELGPGEELLVQITSATRVKVASR